MQWCYNNLYRVIGNHKWPANSTDLNPLDYYFWTDIERKMEKKNFKNREELISGIEEAIAKVPKNEIAHACNSFFGRLRKEEQAIVEYVLS